MPNKLKKIQRESQTYIPDDKFCLVKAFAKKQKRIALKETILYVVGAPGFEPGTLPPKAGCANINGRFSDPLNILKYHVFLSSSPKTMPRLGFVIRNYAPVSMAFPFVCKYPRHCCDAEAWPICHWCCRHNIFSGFR
jgi:hypothetical protein